MKGFLRIVILLLLPLVSGAQTYYPIKHGPGTQVVGVNPITVLGDGEVLSGVGTVCGEGPYEVGVKPPPPSPPKDPKTYFQFNFTYPVNAIRLRVVNIGGDDTVGIDINGNFFPVNSTHISNSLTAQIACIGEMPVIHNGLLCPATIPSPGYNSKAHLDIKPGFPITQLTVRYTGMGNTGNGVAFSLWYVTDPHVYIKEPYTDTVVCAGDTFNVPIFVTDTFDAGNTFTVQLSDKDGSFVNPVAIGTRNARNGGNINCTIPMNMPDGTGYRFRVIADLPWDTTAVNTRPIRLTHYPTLSVTSNSPVCEGDMIRLNALTDNTNLKWTGPSGFKDSVLNPSLISQIKYIGDYKVTTDNYGCATSATTNVQVKPVPIITSIENNGPKCENEEITLKAKTTDTAAKFSWTGPNGFAANVTAPRIADVRLASAGVYAAKAILNGCVSAADSTTLVIYPRPPVPVISVNNPVKPADSLQFHANGGPDATYQWSGPAGFSSTEQNPVKRLVDANDEGTYTVVATIGNCTSTSAVFVDVLKASVRYFLTPNPTHGDIHIYGNYLVDKTIPFVIVNSTGQNVYSGEITTEDKFLDINLDLKGRFSNGLYFIRLRLKDETLKIPFVIGQ